MKPVLRWSLSLLVAVLLLYGVFRFVEFGDVVEDSETAPVKRYFSGEVQGESVTASSVTLGWYEPPYVPEGEDPTTYWV